MNQESSSVRQETSAFEKMLWQYRGEAGMLIPMLQAAQDSYGYVPASAIERISCVTGTPEAEICGVITFYKQFRLTPLGKHIVRLCKGTACHVVGAETIGQVISDDLNAAPDETTEDGIFTYMVVACLGCCSLAPAMMIDDQTYGRLTPQTTRKLLRQYRREAEAAAGSD
jgi:NADH-quinone oxidoreductase subunit E